MIHILITSLQDPIVDPAIDAPTLPVDSAPATMTCSGHVSWPPIRFGRSAQASVK